MASSIFSGSSRVHILAANIEKAFDALCEQAEAGHPLLKFTSDSLEGALDELGWQVAWGGQDIVNLSWQSLDDNEPLMNDTLAAIAPFVEDGSYLSFIDNDSDTIYYYFVGGWTYFGAIEALFDVLSAARSACGENGWRMVPGEPNAHTVMQDKLLVVLGAGAEARLVKATPPVTPLEPV